MLCLTEQPWDVCVCVLNTLVQDFPPEQGSQVIWVALRMLTWISHFELKFQKLDHICEVVVSWVHNSQNSRRYTVLKFEIKIWKKMGKKWDTIWNKNRSKIWSKSTKFCLNFQDFQSAITFLVFNIFWIGQKFIFS